MHKLLLGCAGFLLAAAVTVGLPAQALAGASGPVAITTGHSSAECYFADTSKVNDSPGHRG